MWRSANNLTHSLSPFIAIFEFTLKLLLPSTILIGSNSLRSSINLIYMSPFAELPWLNMDRSISSQVFHPFVAFLVLWTGISDYKISFRGPFVVVSLLCFLDYPYVRLLSVAIEGNKSIALTLYSILSPKWMSKLINVNCLHFIGYQNYTNVLINHPRKNPESYAVATFGVFRYLLSTFLTLYTSLPHDLGIGTTSSSSRLHIYVPSHIWLKYR